MDGAEFKDAWTRTSDDKPEPTRDTWLMGISRPGGINPSQLLSKQSPTPAPVGPGSPAKDVQGVQNALTGLGYRIEAKEDQADTYGASTQVAVRQFQKDQHLPETGIADGQTRLALEVALHLKQDVEREKNALLAQLMKTKFGP